MRGGVETCRWFSRDCMRGGVETCPDSQGIVTKGNGDPLSREERIEYYFNYQRNPKGNEYKERFNKRLMEYLIWYNGGTSFWIKNKPP